MTEESTPDQAVGSDSPPEVIAHIEDKDWFLADLIRVFANLGVEFPITLHVRGSVISGKLIGGKTYFEEQSRLIASGTSNHLEIRDLLVQMVDQSKLIYERPEDAHDAWTAPSPGFVHLRDARIFSAHGEPMPSNQGMLWRGKLSSVDGFWFGSLNASRN